ncbi:MAG TPA: tetratricopeptide repeat protein [Opitutus sp.]|nr:tetratricopeptide repeat protein [Opitutus sp.]
MAITLLISSTAAFGVRASENPVAATSVTAEAAVSESGSAQAVTDAAATKVSEAIAVEPAALTAIAAPVEVKSEVFTTTSGVTAREAQGLNNLGVTLTDRGDFAAAEIAYRQVLRGEAPLEHTKAALLGLARMHRKKGELTKAAAIYERYLKDFPSDERVPDALLELGRTLRDMGAPRLAIARFYNVINSTLKLPTHSGFEHYQLLAKTAQFEVAETHFQSGDFAEANKFFSRLRMLDLAPTDRARAHFKAAYSLHLANDFEGAVTGLRSYIDQWPEDENIPEARHLLAITLRSLNRSQEALVATLELLRSEQSRSAADGKRWSYWQRRTGNQLANEFFQSGDILNALAIYHGLAALSDDPAWRVPVAYQIALCYERLSDPERACKTYHTILDTAGANPTPDIADVARMANARLAYVEWRTNTDNQVVALFDSTTGTPSPAPSKPASLNDSDRSPASAPATL